MKRFLKYSLFLLNLIFALALAICRLVPMASPYEYSFLALLGIFTPVLFVVNSIFFFLWLFNRKWLYILVPAVALLMAWPVVRVCFSFHPQREPVSVEENKSFRVLSYNVRLLDLYHWSGREDTRKKMLEFFRTKNADVLCLQEFYTGSEKNTTRNLEAIRRVCGYEYQAECNMYVSRRGKWGSVLFSHFPILNTSNIEIDMNGNNLLQKADLQIGTDTVSVFNVHLKSNKLSKAETEMMQHAEVPSWTDSNLKYSRSILAKLQDNATNRALEADIVFNTVSMSRYPTLVCGDFNDLPCSYVYFRIRGQLQDAFLEKGMGLGNTYRSRWPFFRIDYLFHHPKIKLLQFETLQVPWSDHNPVIATFQKNNPHSVSAP
ncbi:MAG TPA: endonuclease/exonuclease/phosphatase family protein [Chitinophagaceae bacterium]|nr:endonuclease/exonuclease/phosphatase family protein [Chitinophagaceae bacterium]HNF71529.1 endonuclease/exonuclease/phosphatase family protein [Chitinophagaceae bacterium]